MHNESCPAVKLPLFLQERLMGNAIHLAADGRHPRDQRPESQPGSPKREGIAGNLRAHYPPWLLRSIVGLLLVANILNLGADLGAMGAATHLLVAGSPQLYVVVFAVGCALLEIFSRYERYASILKWTSVSLFAYVATALVVHVPWGQVAFATFVPSFTWQTDYIVTIVAVLGTTITPYCFFWQSSEEAEEERLNPAAHSLLEAPAEAPSEIKRIRVDTWVGKGFSNLISCFIIVTTAATLNAHGITDIQTSAQAADALRPIAGAFTFAIFAVGIIGASAPACAVPVLAGSAACALGEALRWPPPASPTAAACMHKAFYGTIVVGDADRRLHQLRRPQATQIKALFWCAVINGVVAVPLMVMIMIMAKQKKVMGPFILPRSLWAMGWLCTAAMAVAVVIMFVTW